MIKVGIVGGTGYTGVELLRLLAAHPHVQLDGDHVAQGRRHAGSRHVSFAARPRERWRFRRRKRRT